MKSLLSVILMLSSAMLLLSSCTSAAPTATKASTIIAELNNDTENTAAASAEICGNFSLCDKKLSILFKNIPDGEILENILNTLEEKNIQALFFATADECNKKNEAIIKIADAGFEIGIYIESTDISEAVEELCSAQEFLLENGSTPEYILTADNTYSSELLMAIGLAEIKNAVIPDYFLNAASFKDKNDAIMFLHKMPKGSIVIFDTENTDTDSASNSIVASIDFFANAINSKNFSAVTPEELRAASISEEAETIELSPNELEQYNINNYTKYVTDEPFGIQESEAKTEDYFNNTVFVGDSISVKLRMYVEYMRKKQDSFLGNAQFLTTQGLSVGNSLWELTDESKHPYYNGEHLLIQDAIEKMDVDKVYIMLGINDIPSYSLERYLENYNTLITLIKEKSPNVEIYIQSITPCIESRTKIPTNTEIFTFDLALAKFCRENNYNFVDVAYTMRDMNGNLPDSYCYDTDTMGLHFTNEACQKWIDFLLTHTQEE